MCFKNSNKNMMLHTKKGTESIRLIIPTFILGSASTTPQRKRLSKTQQYIKRSISKARHVRCQYFSLYWKF